MGLSCTVLLAFLTILITAVKFRPAKFFSSSISRYKKLMALRRVPRPPVHRSVRRRHGHARAAARWQMRCRCCCSGSASAAATAANSPVNSTPPPPPSSRFTARLRTCGSLARDAPRCLHDTVSLLLLLPLPLLLLLLVSTPFAGEDAAPPPPPLASKPSDMFDEWSSCSWCSSACCW